MSDTDKKIYYHEDIEDGKEYEEKGMFQIVYIPYQLYERNEPDIKGVKTEYVYYSFVKNETVYDDEKIKNALKICADIFNGIVYNYNYVVQQALFPKKNKIVYDNKFTTNEKNEIDREVKIQNAVKKVVEKNTDKKINEQIDKLIKEIKQVVTTESIEDVTKINTKANSINSKQNIYLKGKIYIKYQRFDIYKTENNQDKYHISNVHSLKNLNENENEIDMFMKFCSMLFQKLVTEDVQYYSTNFVNKVIELLNEEANKKDTNQGIKKVIKYHMGFFLNNFIVISNQYRNYLQQNSQSNN